MKRHLSSVLEVAGFGAVLTAAFLFHVLAGVAVAGVVLVVVSYALGRGAT